MKMRKFAFVIVLIAEFLNYSCKSTLQEVKQWHPIELNFCSTKFYNVLDFPMKATFIHEDGTVLMLDGYWNGDNNWQVRFAPTKPGIWKWSTQSEDKGLNNKSGKLLCFSATPEEIDKNPNYRGKVSIKSGNRFFQYADGTPVLLLAEQFWDFNVSSWITVNDNLPNSVENYLENRKSKGFNVVQMRFMRPSRKNEGGYIFPCNTLEGPGNGCVDTMNADYFYYLDERFRMCFDKGFVVAGHPEWIGHDFDISYENAQKLERYFMARYGAYNLIYSISGEFDKNFHKDNRNKEWVKGRWNDGMSDSVNIKDDSEVWRNLGRYVGQFNVYQTPLSVHPGWHQPKLASSGDYLQNEDWFDHSWIQTYKDVFSVPQAVREDYDRIPTKPVFFSEGIREGDQTNEINVGAYGVRWEAWQSLLSGATAHTYRHFGVYSDRYHIKGETGPIHSNLESPGAAQVCYAIELLRRLEWWKLVPMHENLRINGKAPEYPYSSTQAELDKMVNMAAINKNTRVIYIPMNSVGNEIKVTAIEGIKLIAHWYNPMNGRHSEINSGTPLSIDPDKTWVIPERPDNNDWVLVIRSTEE